MASGYHAARRPITSRTALEAVLGAVYREGGLGAVPRIDSRVRPPD
jgi:hypothetical protein